MVDRIENEQQRHDLYSLLTRFQQTFDIPKHDIANASIHHVINTVPHLPLAPQPYLQSDKAKVMHKLIHEFLQADLITESHSPYATPALLAKKRIALFGSLLIIES